MELAGLNVGNYVVAKLFGDEEVPINCAAADVKLKDGLAKPDLFVFDTENAVINIDGSVNFKSEDIDLDITPHSKGLRIISLRSPLYVAGTLRRSQGRCQGRAAGRARGRHGGAGRRLDARRRSAGPDRPQQQGRREPMRDPVASDTAVAKAPPPRPSATKPRQAR